MKLYNFNQFIHVLENSQYFELDAIYEGGAYGHLNHPFEDIGLTFMDLEEMLMATVNGAFGPENFVQEKCLSPDCLVELEKGGVKTIKDVVDSKIEDRILSFNEITNSIEFADILNWVKNEKTSEWLEIETEHGQKIVVTPNHRMFVHNKGDVKAENLNEGDELVVFS
jgi:hypothetical protein